MQMKKADDFHPEVLRWFDRYVHGDVDRRGFLHGVARYATGGVTATMLLDLLNPRFAFAQQVPGNDPRIVGKMVDYASPDGSGTMRGYLVRPANATGKLPGILVVHENRGLNPHIEDIARRLALDNFVAFAPDALFPLGGYPGDEDKARELFAKLDQAKTRNDFIAAAGYLKALPESTGKIGVVGFCYGGAIANMLATRLPDLGASVPFYGGATRGGRRGEDQVAAAHPLRRRRRTDQRRLARVRGGAQGRRREIRSVRLRRHAARLQQRHHAALRRDRRETRLDAHRRVLQQEPARLKPRPAPGRAGLRASGARASARR